MLGPDGLQWGGHYWHGRVYACTRWLPYSGCYGPEGGSCQTFALLFPLIFVFFFFPAGFLLLSLVKSIGGGVPDSNVGCLWYVVALGVAYNVIVKMCASSLGRSLSLLLPHIEVDVGLRQTCVNIVLWHFRVCAGI